MSKSITIAIMAALFCLASSPALDAAMPPSMKLGKSSLMLNGAGVRTKSFLQLYQAGLYLPAKASSANDIIAAPQPMAIRIEITSRFVSQAKMVSSLNDGFVNSTKGKVEPLKKEIAAFRKCFADKIVKGDVFELVYQPNVGTAVVKNGKMKGTVKGLGFKQALFGIWLSEKPADAALKQAMLAAPQRR